MHPLMTLIVSSSFMRLKRCLEYERRGAASLRGRPHSVAVVTIIVTASGNVGSTLKQRFIVDSFRKDSQRYFPDRED